MSLFKCEDCDVFECPYRKAPHHVKEEKKAKREMQCFHYRMSYPDGGVRPRGGATVVFIERADEEWLWGVAACSLQDNFCKKRGVQIAKGRANSMMEQYPVPLTGEADQEDRGVYVGGSYELPELADRIAIGAICYSLKKALQRCIIPAPFLSEKEHQDAELLVTIHPSFCYVKCDDLRFRITDIDRAEFEEVED